MLWILEDIESLDPEAVLRLLPAISEERRSRVLAMTHVPAQIRSVLAELLLRYALREENGLTDLPRIETGEKGKPFFPALPDVQFNLSHCKTAVACALAPAPVGVDVQELKCVSQDRHRLSAPPIYRILSETERAWVEAGETPAERDRRFTAVWTCKEAYGKATGAGLLYDMSATEFLPQSVPWLQYGFSFQQIMQNDTILTLCAREPLPLHTVSSSAIIGNEGLI